MKQKLGVLALLLLLAGTAQAGSRYIALEASLTTNAAEVVTDTAYPKGYIDEVYVQAMTAGVTASVSFVSNPNVGSSLTPTILYTNGTVTAAAKARPRVTQTDNAGADLSSLTVAERFLCTGDPVTFSVSQVSAVTGLTFKAWLKIND